MYTAAYLISNGVIAVKDPDWNEFIRFAQQYAREAKWGIFSDSDGGEYTVPEIRELKLNPGAFTRSGSRLSGEYRGYSISELAVMFREGYRLVCRQSAHYLAAPIEEELWVPCSPWPYPMWDKARGWKFPRHIVEREREAVWVPTNQMVPQLPWPGWGWYARTGLYRKRPQN